MKLPRFLKIAVIAALFLRCQPAADVTPDFITCAHRRRDHYHCWGAE